MKHFGMTFLLLVIILCVSIPAQSSTITVAIDGLEMIEPDGIWSYQMNWGIEGDTQNVNVTFNTTDQHLWEVAPGVSIVNWNLLWNVRGDGTLVVLADEKDYGDKAPLVNGELFTIEYDNASLILMLDSFLLKSDLVTLVLLDKYPADVVFGEGDHTLTLAPVPIPGGLILLGSGLIGLIGLGRRRIKKS